jgi:hypothetical protein
VSPDNPPPRITVVTTGTLVPRIYMDDYENGAQKEKEILF